MKVIMTIIFAMTMFSLVTAQPAGKVVCDVSMPSNILNWNVNYCIYLPPDYDQSMRNYPVVYLLHGYGDKEWGWVQFGEVNVAADRAIAAREIPPMIIVMPEARLTFYVNDYRGRQRYEDMFIREFIPYIDKRYRTRADKEFRGVSGLSMGGYGALMFSMRYPNTFSACAAFSAAVWRHEDLVGEEASREYNRGLKDLFGPLENGQLPKHFRLHNPLDLAKGMPADTLKKVRYYIDCGDDDFLIQGNMALHEAMLTRKIPHEFRVRDGSHSWPYWRSGIVDGLKFIGKSFHRF